MAKAVKRPIIIESESEDSDSDQDVHHLSSAAKRPKPSAPAAQSSGSGSSSDSDDDDEWTVDNKSGASGSKKTTSNMAKKGRGAGGGKAIVQRKSVGKKLPQPSSSESSEEEDDEDGGKSGDSSSSDESSTSGVPSRTPSPFSDGLDDNLVGDEEDQRKLSLMSEMEREAVMYKRFEKREALKTRFEIEQKLYRQRKQDKEKQKEKQKHSLRHKRGKQQDRSKSQAMDEYKAKRSADKIRKAEAAEKEPLKASDIFTSDSDEEYTSTEDSGSQRDSDDEAGAKVISGLKQSAPQYVSTGHELGKIRLSRYRLEKWVHMPFFTEAARGCFVRIGIGANEGRMVYRICEIIGVQETPKIYSLGNTKTNKGLKLRHALQERVFRMEYVSNSQFSDTEFHKWKVEMEKRGLKLPTMDYVRQKSKKLEEMKNMSLKEEDVEKIIQEKKRFKKNPSNYAMTKNRLIREKETAEEEGDVEKTKNLIDKLNELEERADLLDKQRTKGLSAISYINERNRQRNVVRAELALKEELAAGEGKADDPFTRRKCQPKLVTLAVREASGNELLQQLSQQSKTTTSTANSSSSAEGATAAQKDMATPNGQERKSSRVPESTPSASLLSTTPAPPRPEQPDDLFSAHDFDIQIDLPSAGSDATAPKVMPKSNNTPKQNGPKRSLNLSDYKKRRGLI